MRTLLYPKNLRKKIFDYYENYYKEKLGIPNWRELAEGQEHEEELELEKLTEIEKVVGVLKNKTILDVGCGTGGFAIAASFRGCRVYAIDPDKEALKIAKEKTKLLKLEVNFEKEEAENLPYKKNFFDFVYSYTVLEHVQNVQKALKEIVRVTKRGGLIYINFPNYAAFYEGHYKIFWIPFMPKFIGRFYLILRNRPFQFLNTINYVNESSIRKELLKYKLTEIEMPQGRNRVPGIINFFIYQYYLIFNIRPSITMVFKKASNT